MLAGATTRSRLGQVAWLAAGFLLIPRAVLAQPQPPTVQVRPAPLPTDALIQAVTTASPVRAQRPVVALPPGLALRLQRAVDLRVSGLPERARDTLLVLLRERPHHPAIVTELGRAQLAREDWAAVERLATGERAASRDSSLLGQELAAAFERLGRPKDAIRVAVEAWSVSMADVAWASGVLFRLAPAEPRTAASTLEAAAGPRPWRTDLTLGLARLHAMSGRPADAVRVLSDAEKRSGRTGLRVMFADEALRTGRTADTTAALTALVELAADPARRQEERLAAARRGWSAAQASGREAEWAPRLAQSLREIPAERWGADLVLSLVRSLQRAGRTEEARSLLAASPTLEQRMPELKLERALGLAREGPPIRALPLLDSLAHAWPQARFMLAEVQFFAGEVDSAHANYGRVAASPDDADAAAALDRMYLLEEVPHSPLQRLFGQIAFERWRGATAAAAVLADSLWRLQAPRGDYAARAGLELAALKLEAGDPRSALVPLLVVCDSLADDRLAPAARQRAGEAYLALGDEKSALAQYEECLARYPRAWNSAEVRRRVERLRKDRRL
jgi:thioredoxin-like negative regulator of GroEL